MKINIVTAGLILARPPISIHEAGWGLDLLLHLGMALDGLL